MSFGSNLRTATTTLWANRRSAFSTAGNAVSPLAYASRVRQSRRCIFAASSPARPVGFSPCARVLLARRRLTAGWSAHVRPIDGLMRARNQASTRAFTVLVEQTRAGYLTHVEKRICKGSAFNAFN